MMINEDPKEQNKKALLTMGMGGLGQWEELGRERKGKTLMGTEGKKTTSRRCRNNFCIRKSESKQNKEYINCRIEKKYYKNVAVSETEETSSEEQINNAAK